jgi:lactate racemase
LALNVKSEILQDAADIMKAPNSMLRFGLFDGRRDHSLELPRENLLPYAAGSPVEPIQDVEGTLVRRLNCPIGSVPLSDRVRPGMRVVLLCDDYTRPTPAHLLLPCLFRELARCGVRERDITILVAAGHHRAMTREENRQKFGADVADRVRIVHHISDDHGNMVHVGRSSTGIDIRLNRLAVEADFRIGLGIVEIHPWAGFAGGGKIVNPGIAAKPTIDQTHALPILPGVRIGSYLENPFWHTSIESARMLPLNLIVNCLLDLQGRLIEAAAGEPKAAQLHLIAEFRKVNELRFAEPPDIVVTTSYPKFQQWGQAVIALYNAARIVRPGGVRIAVADCPEGMGDCDFEKDYYYRSLTARHRSPAEYWNSRLGKDNCCSRNTCAVHRHLCDEELSEGILVSENLPRDMLNQRVCRSLDDAMAYAFAKRGKAARVAVYDKGGMVLVSLAR